MAGDLKRDVAFQLDVVAYEKPRRGPNGDAITERAFGYAEAAITEEAAGRRVMGQGSSSRGSGTGLGGAGVADDAPAIDCQLNGTVVGLSDGVPGSGELRRAGGDVIVVDQAARIGTLDPTDPLTARIHACLGQSFDYTGVVRVAATGATLIDVATVP